MTENSKGNEVSPVQAAQLALEEFRGEVKAVVALQLKSKAKAIRTLMPSLDKLNKLGFAQEKLVDVMKDEGLEMSLGYLKTALWRERKED